MILRRWRRRFTGLALLLLFGGAALAQGQAWTVQTVALRDLREADGVVAQLRNLGFDAYDGFAMHDGKQFVRVRVGCFSDRAAARAAATALAGHVTEEAVAVPLSAGAKVHRCVREDIGFLKPDSWKRVESGDGAPTFQVDVAGHSASIVFDGQGWVVVQRGAAPPETAALADAAFVAVHPGGVPWVAEELPGGPRLLCPGKLIGQRGRAAVVERADAVVACSFVPVPASLAAGGGP